MSVVHRDDIILRAVRAGVTVDQIASILDISHTWAAQLVRKAKGNAK